MNEEMLLQHLLRSGITPSFSFPLDVCEFRGEGTLGPFKPRVWPKMQQDRKRHFLNSLQVVNLQLMEINTELAAYTSTIPRIKLIEPGIYLLKR